MRVVHVSAYFAPAFAVGGPATSLFQLCRALRDAGVDIEVLTTTANGPARLPAAPDGVDYQGLMVRYFPLTRPAALLGGDGLAAAVVDAARHADVVHVHGLWNQTVWDAAAAARVVGRPWVLSPRGMLEPAALAHHRWRKRAAWWLRDRRVVSSADLLHATSPIERQTLAAYRRSDEIVEIPNGVVAPAPGVRRDVRAELGMPPAAPYVLFLGRLHPIKRLDLLLSAFAVVRDVRPDARLVVAGPDEYGLRPEAERAGHGLEAGVLWLGRVEGAWKAALLEQASVFVLCSDSESFGLSAGEAMAAACPVVVTRTCPWPRIEAEGAGLWVDQRADAVAGGLVSLLADPVRARAMGERGRAWMARDFGWPSVAARMAGAYETLLSARRARGRA